MSIPAQETNVAVVKRYRCECGWVGTTKEMESDYAPPGDEGGEESWSDVICPQCHAWWWGLDAYDEVIEA